MSKKAGIVITIISIIAIIVSAVALVLMLNQKPAAEPEQETRDIQYVLYLGTNDKDTNKPVFPPEEAKKEAEKILIEQFGGYTIQEANGGWIDNGIEYQEYTLVIYLSDTDLEHVHKAADRMVDVFHQSSVLIQANVTTTEFYAASN